MRCQETIKKETLQGRLPLSLYIPRSTVGGADGTCQNRSPISQLPYISDKFHFPTEAKIGKASAGIQEPAELLQLQRHEDIPGWDTAPLSEWPYWSLTSASWDTAPLSGHPGFSPLPADMLRWDTVPLSGPWGVSPQPAGTLPH